ncbi:MAG: prepilin-type N-terminal cleavage/methylation domain-containing protein [Kiritimatiellia bacterium]
MSLVCRCHPFKRKRGGRSLRARVRLHARRGVTLVELMIAMLILAIVCVAWLEIIGVQSARREARRREAVERLAGMMDAFLYVYKSKSVSPGCYQMTSGSTLLFEQVSTATAFPLYESDVSPIGYRLDVVTTANLSDAALFTGDWTKKWLVGKLYDRSGSDAGEPFFTLPVYIGL